MKKKPSILLKQIFSFLKAMVKDKTMAMKNKTSAIKAKLLIFNLFHNKKIHTIMGENYAKAIEMYNNATKKISPNISIMEDVEFDDEEEEEDDYSDLRNSLFELKDENKDEDEDDELVNGTGSVIDLVKNSRNSREDGNEFSLEDEIDHVADVFIKRFHRQMRIQKQESLKRHREMLARGVNEDILN